MNSFHCLTMIIRFLAQTHTNMNLNTRIHTDINTRVDECTEIAQIQSFITSFIICGLKSNAHDFSTIALVIRIFFLLIYFFTQFHQLIKSGGIFSIYFVFLLLYRSSLFISSYRWCFDWNLRSNSISRKKENKHPFPAKWISFSFCK